VDARVKPGHDDFGLVKYATSTADFAQSTTEFAKSDNPATLLNAIVYRTATFCVTLGE
jgi:hypothetical protein